MKEKLCFWSHLRMETGPWFNVSYVSLLMSHSSDTWICAQLCNGVWTAAEESWHSNIALGGILACQCPQELQWLKPISSGRRSPEVRHCIRLRLGAICLKTFASAERTPTHPTAICRQHLQQTIRQREGGQMRLVSVISTTQNNVWLSFVM